MTTTKTFPSASVQLEVRKPDGTAQIRPQVYANMTDAWDDMLALQAEYGDANVRHIVA